MRSGRQRLARSRAYLKPLPQKIIPAQSQRLSKMKLKRKQIQNPGKHCLLGIMDIAEGIELISG